MKTERMFWRRILDGDDIFVGSGVEVITLGILCLGDLIRDSCFGQGFGGSLCD